MFKDYKKEDFCNPRVKNCFAIELEVSHIDLNLHSNYKRESSKIFEFLGVHNKNTDYRLDLLDKTKEIYKDKFPVGERNSYISGGVHFLLFGDFDCLFDRYTDILKNNLLNLPLYCKIDKDTQKFYTRYLDTYCSFTYDFGRLEEDRKCTPVTLKRELYSNGGEKSGIEFRLNNVIDDRLLGYYQAQTILFRDGIELNTIDLKDKYFTIGETKSFEGKDYADLKELEGRKLSEPTRKILLSNLDIVFKALEKEGLPKSKEKLEEYCIEYGIIQTEEVVTF